MATVKTPIRSRKSITSGNWNVIPKPSGSIITNPSHSLIRGSGVRGAARADKQCPNCGVDLAINMAGNCPSCQAKVTAGQFDWVLSRIEQDEAYQG